MSDLVLPSFGETRVLSGGDPVVDKYVDVELIGVSTEDRRAGCYEEVGEELSLPGSVGTTARCIRALRGKVVVCSVVGDDRNGVEMTEGLDRCGADVRFIIEQGRTTPRKRRYVDITEPGKRKMVMVSERGKRPVWISAASEAGMVKLLEELVPGVHVVTVTDNNRGVVTERVARALSELARAHGKPLIVDARPRPAQWYTDHFPHMHLITPTSDEASAMVGWEILNLDDVDRAGRELHEKLGCNVLITLSADGARLYQDGNRHVFRARNGRPISVCGAGDTLVATIALCIGAGMSLPMACEVAQYASAITVAQPGTGVVSLAELHASLASEGWRVSSTTD